MSKEVIALYGRCWRNRNEQERTVLLNKYNIDTMFVNSDWNDLNLSTKESIIYALDFEFGY